MYRVGSLSKDSYILMVFEESKTEPQSIRKFKKYFFLNESDKKKIVKAVYGTVIYGLYKNFSPIMS